MVTGGAGFFGSWLVEHLLATGTEVTVVDRQAGAMTPSPGLRVIEATADDATFDTLLAQPLDVVFHLAGPALVPLSLADPWANLEESARPTLALLNAAVRAAAPPTVVLASSAAVYGDPEVLPITEEHRLRPKSPYGVAKLACEQYLRLYHDLYGLPTISVRPFSLYGPRQRKLVIYDLLRRLQAGEDPLVIAGHQDVMRDFVFVGDAARGIAQVARAGRAEGEAYNLCSGTGTALGTLVDLLQQAGGTSADTEFTGSVRAGDPMRWTGDPAGAAALGVRCDTPLLDGLALTAEWCRTDGG